MLNVSIKEIVIYKIELLGYILSFFFFRRVRLGVFCVLSNLIKNNKL